MGLEILFILIPVTLVLAVGGLLLFVWAIRSGQFDDLDTPALRVLFDEESKGESGSSHDTLERPTLGEKDGNEHGDFPIR